MSIGVWDEAWLPGDSVVNVPTPNLNFDSALKVADLIEMGNGVWNEGLVRKVLNAEESALLLDYRSQSRFPLTNVTGGRVKMVATQ